MHSLQLSSHLSHLLFTELAKKDFMQVCLQEFPSRNRFPSHFVHFRAKDIHSAHVVSHFLFFLFFFLKENFIFFTSQTWLEIYAKVRVGHVSSQVLRDLSKYRVPEHVKHWFWSKPMHDWQFMWHFSHLWLSFFNVFVKNS